MKSLLIGEYREKKLQDATYELIAFAESIHSEAVMFLVGSEKDPDATNEHVNGKPEPTMNLKALTDELDKCKTPAEVVAWKEKRRRDGSALSDTEKSKLNEKCDYIKSIFDQEASE